MPITRNPKLETIIDREMLMTLKRCPACNQPFNLGDPVVLACGDWHGPPRLIHESEAIFDQEQSIYIERGCYEAGRQPCVTS